jgi:hypothetical protein
MKFVSRKLRVLVAKEIRFNREGRRRKMSYVDEEDNVRIEMLLWIIKNRRKDNRPSFLKQTVPNHPRFLVLSRYRKDTRNGILDESTLYDSRCTLDAGILELLKKRGCTVSIKHNETGLGTRNAAIIKAIQNGDLNTYEKDHIGLFRYNIPLLHWEDGNGNRMDIASSVVNYSLSSGRKESFDRDGVIYVGKSPVDQLTNNFFVKCAWCLNPPSNFLDSVWGYLFGTKRTTLLLVVPSDAFKTKTNPTRKYPFGLGL